MPDDQWLEILRVGEALGALTLEEELVPHLAVVDARADAAPSGDERGAVETGPEADREALFAQLAALERLVTECEQGVPRPR